MNREEMTRPDDLPAQATSASSDIPSPPAHIAARSVSALSIKALARHRANQQTLLAREPAKQPFSLR